MARDQYDPSLVHHWETSEGGEWPVKTYSPLCSPFVEHRVHVSVAEAPDHQEQPPAHLACPTCVEITTLIANKKESNAHAG